MQKELKIKGKTYQLPIFLPDATRAVTKSVDNRDVKEAGIEGIVVNTYHLLTDPGMSVIKTFGGVKNYMNYHEGLVVTDSGGWQLYSLLHKNKKAGSISDRGVTFVSGGKKELLTPEKCIDTQFEIGSDIMICLDDFTPPDAEENRVKESVERTILWAQRCKKHFWDKVTERGLSEANRPHLFAVIQGGRNMDLRKYCAQKLVAMDFNGYGFGGYLVDEENHFLNMEVAENLANLIPNEKVKFALGNGTPLEIALCSKVGWDIFDCTLPTRDARNKRLYIFNKEPKKHKDLEDPTNHGYLYIGRDEFRRDKRPISEFCDCYTCKNYTRAYLNHLFNIEDDLAPRLATIHNLRTFSKTIEVLRSAQ